MASQANRGWKLSTMNAAQAGLGLLPCLNHGSAHLGPNQSRSTRRFMLTTKLVSHCSSNTHACPQHRSHRASAHYTRSSVYFLSVEPFALLQMGKVSGRIYTGQPLECGDESRQLGAIKSAMKRRTSK